MPTYLWPPIYVCISRSPTITKVVREFRVEYHLVYSVQRLDYFCRLEGFVGVPNTAGVDGEPIAGP